MINELKQEAMLHGDKLQVIPIKRLQSIKNEIDVFKENEDLNGFQNWIVNDLYKFEVPMLEFTIKSIILIAVPHPAYANVELTRQGKKYNVLSLAASDIDNTEKYLKDFLVTKKFHIEGTSSLPMKRLAAQSGLAVYGRNNICYVEGMGSCFSFVAYFSDIPFDNDEWTEMRHAETCTKCKVCLNNCPTGAIRAERFLIDNERCLSYFNEMAAEFPQWIPKSAHHCIYDCLKCQIKCPMNKEYVNNVIGPIKFSEDETEMLMQGRTYDEFSPELKQKSNLLGLHRWPDGIPKNLRVLFELSESQEIIV